MSQINPIGIPTIPQSPFHNSYQSYHSYNSDLNINSYFPINTITPTIINNSYNNNSLLPSSSPLPLPLSLPLPFVAVAVADNSTSTYQDFFNSLDPTEEHLNILEFPVDELIEMLSSLLTKIIESNDKLNVSDTLDPTVTKDKYTINVLAFHGKNVPGISLNLYLSRILKYCPVTTEVFLSLLVYFDRIAKNSNNNNNTNHFIMDSYNIHRLIISGVTISSKFFSDIFYKNLRYAKVGGLPLEELNYLEIQFLLLLDFKLLISLGELQKYGDLLLKYWKREINKD